MWTAITVFLNLYRLLMRCAERTTGTDKDYNFKSCGRDIIAKRFQKKQWLSEEALDLMVVIRRGPILNGGYQKRH